MNTNADYWFTIEPYVYIKITSQCVFLYNTLDGEILESHKKDVIDFLNKILHKENCGVVFLTNERYNQNSINEFVKNVREKYMGDIISIDLSNGKPVQLFPYVNYSCDQAVYKKHNFSSFKNVLENLSEISIHVDAITDISKLIPVLISIPWSPTFNIVGDIFRVLDNWDMLCFFNKRLSPKIIFCSYDNFIPIDPVFDNNFSYRISVKFPINMQHWNDSRRLLLDQALPFEYVFDVSSNEDLLQMELLIEQYQIEKYQSHPVYTGDNISFFEQNVFLSREDILSMPITINDLFIRQVMNIYDYGKINILPNGDVYANLNHPVLGNVYTDNIYEVVQKEVSEGKSWFNVRNQSPCTDCVYQWLCPSPSNYEIFIGRPNLCHVKKGEA